MSAAPFAVGDIVAIRPGALNVYGWDLGDATRGEVSKRVGDDYYVKLLDGRNHGLFCTIGAANLTAPPLEPAPFRPTHRATLGENVLVGRMTGDHYMYDERGTCHYVHGWTVEPIAPPLPPEPPIGTVVFDGDGDLAVRKYDQWHYPFDSIARDWAGVCKYGAVTILAPRVEVPADALAWARALHSYSPTTKSGIAAEFIMRVALGGQA